MMVRKLKTSLLGQWATLENSLEIRKPLLYSYLPLSPSVSLKWNDFTEIMNTFLVAMTRTTLTVH